MNPVLFKFTAMSSPMGLLDADVLDMPGRSEMIWLDAWDIANKLLADYAHEYASAQTEVERQQHCAGVRSSYCCK